MMYKICPDCGSHLDFGEKCDCKSGQQQETGNTSERGDDNGGRTTAAGGTVSWSDHNPVRAG